MLQYLVFACFQGGKGPVLAVGFILQKYSSVEFHFGGETAWLGAPGVALRCVWTVSYSSELECILADFFSSSGVRSGKFLISSSSSAQLLTCKCLRLR